MLTHVRTYMQKRYYVYIDNVIVGYVESSAYDNEMWRSGAIQKARDHFGDRCDVVDSRNRSCNVSFDRVTKTVFRKRGYEAKGKSKQVRERVIRGYDVRTNTFT